MNRKECCEDDVLAVFGEYLKKNEFLILSLSGNQQGLYWYNIGTNRKGPDVIAIHQNKLIVGEGKVVSRNLFKSDSRGISDYSSLQFLMDNVSAQQQLIIKIKNNINRKFCSYNGPFQIIPILIGGDSFENLVVKMDDKRIVSAYSNVENGNTKIENDSYNILNF